MFSSWGGDSAENEKIWGDWLVREIVDKKNSPYPEDNPYVDLHAHLFMKQGMGTLFYGDFLEPMKAKKWSDALSSQADPVSLQRSRMLKKHKKLAKKAKGS